MSYIAANGQEITEAMIGSWCDAYERGEFPEGERTVGEVVMVDTDDAVSGHRGVSTANLS